MKTNMIRAWSIGLITAGLGFAGLTGAASPGEPTSTLAAARAGMNDATAVGTEIETVENLDAGTNSEPTNVMESFSDYEPVRRSSENQDAILLKLQTYARNDQSNGANVEEALNVARETERRRRPRYSDLRTSEAPTSYMVPVQGVRKRDLADTWGATRSEGRTHEGIDIFAKRNTPIISSTDGVISRIGETERGGLVVWVVGPGGQRHYYAHLESHTDHEVGDRVVAGEVIGYVGNSGNAITTPTHLHYGVYTDSGAINPYPLLIGAK